MGQTDSGLAKDSHPAPAKGSLPRLKPKPDSKRDSNLRAWRNHDFFLAFVVGFVFMAEVGVYAVYAPLFPYRLRDLGYNNVSSAAGYLASAYAGGLAIGSPAYSYIGNRFAKHKRTILALSLLGLASSVIIFLFVSTLPFMLLARGIEGIAGAGVWTVALAILADGVKPRRIGKLTGFALVGMGIGTTCSQPISGALYSKKGWRAPSFYALALIIVALVLTSLIQEDVSSKDKESADDGIEHVAKSYKVTARIRHLVKAPRLLSALGVSFFYGAYQGGLVNTALTLRLIDRYQLSAKQVGNTYLALALPTLLISPLAGWLTDRLGARKVVLVCLSSYICWLSLLCIDTLPYPAAVVMLVGAGFSTSLVNAPILTYLAVVDRSNGAVVGSSMLYGLWNLSISISSLLFPLATGQILQRCGVSLGWKIILGIILGGAAMSLVGALSFMRSGSLRVSGAGADAQNPLKC